jgi:SAM-dependent methyltransferase
VRAIDERAAQDAQAYYDERYRRGYMEGFEGLFEACRLRTIRETLAGLEIEPRRALDYGCGNGRYLHVLRERFPHAELAGGDISDVALEHARRRPAADRYLLMADERVPAPDATFDLILCVEVLEHVGDVHRATLELGRLLAPGGRLLLTTPCANPGSLEWLINRRHGGPQPTPDGFGRFATDEPGHLRRLTSRDLRVLLGRAGIEVQRIDFRAHLFTTLVARLPPRVRRSLPRSTRMWIAMLDWHLRRLPNGATMLVLGRRRPA